MLFIGFAEPKSRTSIKLSWPAIEFQNNVGQSLGTVTWDVLVTTAGAAGPPTGTGNFTIATGISGSCGTNGMCSFTDTQAAPSSYTVPAQQFTPVFWFWPVSLVINGTTVFADAVGGSPSAVASQGATAVSIVAEQCKSFGAARQRSPIWVSCLNSDGNGGSGTIATVLQEQDGANNGPATDSKGRLNFGKPIVNTPNDLITLQDSNFMKTTSTAGERPSNDAGDMALGLDQPGGLAERAQNSISQYIDALPRGTNYLERLTAAAKTFKVPIATPAAIIQLSTSPIAAHTCRVQGTELKGVTTSSVIKWSYAGSAIRVAGYGTGELQISTFSTPGTGNIMVCNTSERTITPGAITVNIREEL